MSYKFFFFECAFILLYYVPNSHQHISDIRKNYVSIQSDFDITNQNSGDHFCSGAIVGDKHVLTSARCFVIQENGRMISSIPLIRFRIVVVAGISVIGREDIIMHVRKVFVPHARNLEEELIGNVAILQLADTLSLENNRDRLLSLPLDRENAVEPYENKDAVVPGNSCAGVLRAQIGALDQHYNGFVVREFLHVHMLRTKQREYYDYLITAIVRERPQLRSCVDEGSPLVYEDKIIGVYSRPIERKQNMKFTRVSKFIHFIDRAMDENGERNNMYVLEN